MFEFFGLSVTKLASVSRAPGRTIEVPGRGETFVYEMEGPPDAPVLFLIHGLVASTQLNWFPAFPVLAATSRNFGGTLRERTWYRMVPGIVVGTRVVGRVRGGGRAPEEIELGDDALLSRWAMEELRRVSPAVALQAMSALGRFSSHEWIGEVNVPTAVVVTTKDRFISPTRQIKLANAIPDATIHPVHAGHAACVLAYRRFVPGLVEACDSVAGRLSGRVENNSEKLRPGQEEA